MKATVKNAKQIKEALKNHCTELVPTTKEAKILLLALSKVPAAALASGASVATVTAAATSALGISVVALSTAQTWVIVLTGSAVMLILAIKANHAKIVAIKGPDGEMRFEVHFDK